MHSLKLCFACLKLWPMHIILTLQQEESKMKSLSKECDLRILCAIAVILYNILISCVLDVRKVNFFYRSSANCQHCVFADHQSRKLLLELIAVKPMQ